MGGLRTRGELPVSLYVGGNISSERPEFCWGAVKDARTYRLILWNTQTNRQIWNISTTSTCEAYPATMSPLAPSEYEWEIKATSEGTTLAGGTAVFEVKPVQDLMRSTGADADDSFLRAIELENRGYYSEAAAYFREARGANPADKRLTQHLAWLYWSSGLVSAANEEFKQLAAATDK